MRSHSNGFAKILPVLLIALAIPAAIYLVKQNADTRSRASGPLTQPVTPPCLSIGCHPTSTPTASLLPTPAVSQPIITSITPVPGRLNEIITVMGAGFGSNTGQFIFRQSGSPSLWYGAVVSWTDSQIKVVVPSNLSPIKYIVQVYTATGRKSADFYETLAATQNSAIAKITKPTPGSLVPNTTTFSWSALPYAQEYALQVGTTPAGSNIYNKPQGLNTSVKVTNLAQTPGVKNGLLYVRLLTRIQNVWLYTDYTYQVVPLVP